MGRIGVNANRPIPIATASAINPVTATVAGFMSPPIMRLTGADGMTIQRYDVAVIGVGIVGASAVYALARAGARVVALDAGVPGAGTSGTSFAWVNSVRKEPEVYHRLN